MADRKIPACCAGQSPVRVPNRETVEALRQSRDGKGLQEYASLEDLKAEFE